MPRLSFLLALVAVLLALHGARAQAAPATAAAPTKAQDSHRRAPAELPPDPAVRRGVLPNGVRYAVMSNGRPQRGLSLRLHVDVGSFEETEAERGLAHFVEHMAFNGTRNFAENRLDREFAAAGVKFGRDQNAGTSLTGTTYMVDIPVSDAAKADLGFRWLRDVADGVTFASDAVDRERGVILAEYNQHLSPTRTLQRAMAAFMGAGLRSTEREPIGDLSVLKAVDAAALRAFYARWYRPENALVVAVGDLPADELERRVRDAFGSWRAEGPPPQRPARRALQPDKGPQVMVRSEPQLPTTVSVCRPRPWAARSDRLDSWRAELAGEYWRMILNERLGALSRRGDPPFVGATVLNTEDSREAAYTCLVAVPVGNDWRRGLEAAVQEVRRMETHGVTEAERAWADDTLQSRYYAAASSSATRYSADLAQTIVASHAGGRVFASPAARLAFLRRASSGVTIKEVNAAVLEDWRGAGPFLSVAAPSAPTADEVRAAWTQAQAAAPPPPYAAEKLREWAYGDLGEPGVVAARQEMPQGFVRVRYANGVVLNYKRVDSSQDQVQVRISFGAGRREIPTRSLVFATLGASMLQDGGLGRHDAGELQRLFSAGWTLDLDIGMDAFSLQGQTNGDDVEVALGVLTAFLTDPGFRPEIDARLPTGLDIMQRMYRSELGMVAAVALHETVAPQGAYVLPSREEMARIRAADFARLLKPPMVEAPLEVTVVGDVGEDDVVTAVAETLGALPPRAERARERPDTWFLRFPEKAPPPIVARHEGPASKAAVSLTWPLYVATPSRRREEYALNLLADVLDDEIRHVVREDMGKTYSPAAGVEMPDHADQGQLSVFIETTPEDVEAVKAAVLRSAARLAAGDMDEAAVEAVRRPLLDHWADQKRSAEWWAAALDGSARNDQGLKDLTEFEGYMRSLTLADVKKAAATWLSRPPIIVTVLPAAGTDRTATAAKPAPAGPGGGER